MQDRRVGLNNISGAVAVVGIGVQHGNAAEAIGLPQPFDGDRDVVETAVAAEEVSPRVVPSGPDEGKSVDKFPTPDPFGCRDHSSDRVACGRSEGVLCYLPNEVRRVDLQDQLIGNRL